jgi:hypothetical protein
VKDRQACKKFQKHEQIRKVIFLLAIEILSFDFLCDLLMPVV